MKILYDENADNQSYRELVGRKIKRLRKLRGLTQMELAQKIGYDATSMISLVENGRRNINRDKVSAIAKALGVHELALTSDKDYTDAQLRLVVAFFDVLHAKDDSTFDVLAKMLESLK